MMGVSSTRFVGRRANGLEKGIASAGCSTVWAWAGAFHLGS